MTNLLSLNQAHLGKLLTSSTTQTQQDIIHQVNDPPPSLPPSSDYCFIDWPEYNLMSPCTWKNCSDQVPAAQKTPKLSVVQDVAYSYFKPNLRWDIEHCTNVSEDTYWVQVRSFPKDLKASVPSLVPGTPLTTGFGWTNPSLWKFWRGLARSTLMTTKIFTMSMKRQPSSSDSLAWGQKPVSASIGMMEAGASAQNYF